jgi:hypothetical protein
VLPQNRSPEAFWQNKPGPDQGPCYYPWDDLPWKPTSSRNEVLLSISHEIAEASLKAIEIAYPLPSSTKTNHEGDEDEDGDDDDEDDFNNAGVNYDVFFSSPKFSFAVQMEKLPTGKEVEVRLFPFQDDGEEDSAFVSGGLLLPETLHLEPLQKRAAQRPS